MDIATACAKVLERVDYQLVLGTGFYGSAGQDLAAGRGRHGERGSGRGHRHLYSTPRTLVQDHRITNFLNLAFACQTLCGTWDLLQATSFSGWVVKFLNGPKIFALLPCRKSGGMLFRTPKLCRGIQFFDFSLHLLVDQLLHSRFAIQSLKERRIMYFENVIL